MRPISPIQMRRLIINANVICREVEWTLAYEIDRDVQPTHFHGQYGPYCMGHKFYTTIAMGQVGWSFSSNTWLNDANFFLPPFAPVGSFTKKVTK